MKEEREEVKDRGGWKEEEGEREGKQRKEREREKEEGEEVERAGGPAGRREEGERRG